MLALIGDKLDSLSERSNVLARIPRRPVTVQPVRA